MQDCHVRYSLKTWRGLCGVSTCHNGQPDTLKHALKPTLTSTNLLFQDFLKRSLNKAEKIEKTETQNPTLNLDDFLI